MLNQVQCVSNMRQLTHGWLLYTTEHNGKMMIGYPGTGLQYWTDAGNSENAIRIGGLYRYCPNVGMFRCPSDDSGHYRSYSIGQYLNAEPNWSGTMPDPVTNLVQVARHATTYCFVEENDPRGSNLGSFDIPLDTSASAECWIDFVPGFHRGGMNITFCDGHGEYWHWDDPRTLANTGFFTCTPGNPDLKRLQKSLKGW